MSVDFHQLYQGETQAPPSTFPAIPQFESDWHQPLSEPVRFKIAPRLAIVLITTGLIAPVLNPDTQITQSFESKWHQPWSEPKRFPKILLPGLNLFNSLPFPVVPSPSNQLQGWYKSFADPVWPKKGLKGYLQQTLAYHPRMLPRPNVTARIAALSIETHDRSEFETWVYTTQPVPIDLTAVNVSITEIPAQSGGSASITESDP